MTSMYGLIIITGRSKNNYTKTSTTLGEIGASNFKIEQAWSARPIWNYKYDYFLSCLTQGPITDQLYL